jgi:RHS repeat-associated protein
VISQLQLGNGLWENVCLDTLGRQQPTAFRLGAAADANCASAGLARFNFTYHPAGQPTVNNGNVRTQTIHVPGLPAALTQTYEYDEVNRLTVAAENGTPGWSRTNSYDPFGNRTVNVGIAHTISTATNRITGVAEMSAPTYDDAGNMSSHPLIGSLTYDAENRQTTFSGSNKTGTYYYDGQGQRVQRVTTGMDGGTTIYVYDAFGKLAAEYSSATQSDAGSTFYRTTDHLGSTRVVSDQSGEVCEQRDYYPFGEQIPVSLGDSRHGVAGYGQTCGGLAQKFTAKERDAESGLDYFLARYYASSLGRFNSVDPLIGNLLRVVTPQRWNAYAYAVNNPNVYVDPDGLDAIAISFPKYRIGSSGSGVPYLGHAGIVLIEKDGSTTYREYGRYDPEGLGFVQDQDTPSVTIGQNGLPTRESLKELLKAISTRAGQGGSVEGAYFRTTKAEDAAMKAYLEYRSSLNSDANRFPYDSLFHSCQTFCVQTLFAGGQLSPGQALNTPARPISAIEYLRLLSALSVRYEQNEKEEEKVDVSCNGILGCEEPE